MWVKEERVVKEILRFKRAPENGRKKSIFKIYFIDCILKGKRIFKKERIFAENFSRIEYPIFLYRFILRVVIEQNKTVLYLYAVSHVVKIRGVSNIFESTREPRVFSLVSQISLHGPFEISVIIYHVLFHLHSVCLNHRWPIKH